MFKFTILLSLFASSFTITAVVPRTYPQVYNATSTQSLRVVPNYGSQTTTYNPQVVGTNTDIKVIKEFK